MSEQLESSAGFEIRQGSMSAEQWQFLGRMAASVGGECIPITDYLSEPEEVDNQSALRVGIRDFQYFAESKGLAKGIATKAYGGLAHIAQYQLQVPSSFNATLPHLDFAITPSRGGYWHRMVDELDGLDVDSLQHFVAELDKRLATTTTYGKEEIYDELGRMIGPKTIDFWRDFAAHHTSEEA